jgi:hypothetical protein
LLAITLLLSLELTLLEQHVIVVGNRPEAGVRVRWQWGHLPVLLVLLDGGKLLELFGTSVSALVLTHAGSVRIMVL